MNSDCSKFPLKRCTAALVLFAILCSLLACGGGSSGTGGNRFEGSVFSTERVALPGVEVLLAETGISSRTDENGFYSFSSEQPSGDLTYVLTREEGSATITISSLPPSAVISVDFEVNLPANSGNPIRVEVRESDGNSNEDSESVDDDSLNSNSPDDDSLDNDSSGNDSLDDDSFEDDSSNGNSLDDDSQDNSSNSNSSLNDNSDDDDSTENTSSDDDSTDNSSGNSNNQNSSSSGSGSGDDDDSLEDEPEDDDSLDD